MSIPASISYSWCCNYYFMQEGAMDIIYPQISKNKLLYIPYYFLFMNINVIKGFFYFIRKTK